MQHDERHYQRAFETAADPLFVIEAIREGRLRVIDANSACEQLFGIPAKDCVGRFLDEMLPAPVVLQLIDKCEHDVIGGGSPIEVQLDLHAAAGRRVYAVKLNMMPPANDGVIRLIASARDVTELLDVNQQGHEDQFRNIAAHAPDYISRYDREGRTLYMNPATERLIGAKAESRIGKTTLDWNPKYPNKRRFHRT